MFDEAYKKSLGRIQELQEFLQNQKQCYPGVTVVASSPFLVSENGEPYPGAIENLRIVNHYQVAGEDIVLDEELEYVEGEIEECQYSEDEMEKFAVWTEHLLELVRDNFAQYETDLVSRLRAQFRLH